MARVLVLGMDGLNPDLVFSWRDELPHLAEVMGQGIYGKIKSTIPPITPQAWTCALTGKNPGHFGFWDFTFRRDFTYGEPELVSSKEVKAEALYHILPKYGKKVALINVPVTYPPPEIPRGFCISSFLTPSLEKGFTHPPALKDELKGLIGDYIIDASEGGVNFRQMEKDRVMARIYEMDGQRFRLIRYFLEEKDCDLIFSVIMGTDRMPHLFYRYFDREHVRYTPDPGYGSALKDHYRFCDEHIGEIRSMMPPDMALIVLSDHSVQRLDGRINLNEWLIQEGYMKLKARPRGLTPLRDCQVDWERTRAWATGYTGQLYLNMRGREPQGVVEPEDYHGLLDELSEKLKAISGPRGEKLETKTFKRVDVHRGRYSRFGPDLFIYFDDCRWNISELIGYESIYSYDTTKGPDDGGHGPYGFLAMSGPGIPLMGELEGLDLLDIAPTILSIMGVEVPEDMEGRVIIERKEERVYSEEDEREIRERLSRLGYLG